MTEQTPIREDEMILALEEIDNYWNQLTDFKGGDPTGREAAKVGNKFVTSYDYIEMAHRFPTVGEIAVHNKSLMSRLLKSSDQRLQRLAHHAITLHMTAITNAAMDRFTRALNMPDWRQDIHRHAPVEITEYGKNQEQATEKRQADVSETDKAYMRIQRNLNRIALSLYIMETHQYPGEHLDEHFRETALSVVMRYYLGYEGEHHGDMESLLELLEEKQAAGEQLNLQTAIEQQNRAYNPHTIVENIFANPPPGIDVTRINRNLLNQRIAFLLARAKGQPLTKDEVLEAIKYVLPFHNSTPLESSSGDAVIALPPDQQRRKENRMRRKEQATAILERVKSLTSLSEDERRALTAYFSHDANLDPMAGLDEEPVTYDPAQDIRLQEVAGIMGFKTGEDNALDWRAANRFMTRIKARLRSG